ncbi:dTDP-glucose 4,6-dehydratase [Halanaerobium congolense]|jgi:dTDP-glucose 4,6-dehydratase|uniref:dTDP-glucose 4,6-dehydratase n=1 Tax=Halanaerobium congolense TaxID=54121 RepID=A0A1G6QFS0_9FIRM|nr:dTDP-glucose 4,6-dehydratase [Halanaerobium congolense]SDC91239.1 dTDP-glucose 4,6-dehydratase [Halanaerobium congolense]
MKTYLITGGAGFIGSNFIKYLIEKHQNIKIICLDKLTYAGDLGNIEEEINNNPEKITFIKGDINNQELISYIFDQWDINYIVNFAAESHVDRSIEDAEIFLKTNVLGVQNLLNIAKKKWALRERKYKDDVKFIQVSTDEVYGSLGKNGYFTEKSNIQPNSPYSASKASADMLVRSYNKTHGLPTLITRCSNNYGPCQFPEKLIPLMIKNILNGEELPIYGNGLNVRDWLYVKDHCKAIDMVLEKGEVGEVYNIGGNNETTNIKIVKTLIKEIKHLLAENDEYKEVANTSLDNIKEDLITYVKDRPGHDKRYAIDPSKIKREIGWEPTVNFQEGIKKTIKWYISKY